MRADIKERIAMIERGEVPEGYKKTRFGIIPHNWGICSTQHIGLWFGGYAFKSEEFLDEAKPNTVQVIKMGNVKMCRLELSTNPAYLEFGKINNGLTKYMLKTGDVLITLTGTVNKTDYGNVAYISEDGKYVLNQRVGCLRIENVQEKSYYYYYFQSRFFRRNFFILGVGGTGNQANVSITDLSMLQVIKPTSIEQKKIAGIISVWDRAIELKEKLLEQKKLQKKGLIQQILRNCFKMCKRKEIKEVAEQRVEINTDNASLPVLSCTKYDGLVSSLEYFQRQVYGENLESYKVVRKNWFAYATNHIEEGSIGLQLQYDTGLVSPMYTVFELNTGMDEKFVFAILKTETYRRRYETMMNASVNRRGSLRWNDFSKIKIPVPEYETQKRMAQIIRVAENEISLLEKELNFLKNQEKGLMKLLLTGKVRVPC